MSTQNEDRELVHTPAFDPFPQPNTIPSGWDLSGFLPTHHAVPVEEVPSSTEIEAD